RCFGRDQRTCAHSWAIECQDGRWCRDLTEAARVTPVGSPGCAGPCAPRSPARPSLPTAAPPSSPSPPPASPGREPGFRLTNTASAPRSTGSARQSGPPSGPPCPSSSVWPHTSATGLAWSLSPRPAVSAAVVGQGQDGGGHGEVLSRAALAVKGRQGPG